MKKIKLYQILLVVMVCWVTLSETMYPTSESAVNGASGSKSPLFETVRTELKTGDKKRKYFGEEMQYLDKAVSTFHSLPAVNQLNIEPSTIEPTFNEPAITRHIESNAPRNSVSPSDTSYEASVHGETGVVHGGADSDGDKHCEKYILTMKCIGEIEIDTYKSGQKIVQSDQYIILHASATEKDSESKHHKKDAIMIVMSTNDSYATDVAALFDELLKHAESSNLKVLRHFPYKQKYNVILIVGVSKIIGNPSEITETIHLNAIATITVRLLTQLKAIHSADVYFSDEIRYLHGTHNMPLLDDKEPQSSIGAFIVSTTKPLIYTPLLLLDATYANTFLSTKSRSNIKKVFDTMHHLFEKASAALSKEDTKLHTALTAAFNKLTAIFEGEPEDVSDDFIDRLIGEFKILIDGHSCTIDLFSEECLSTQKIDGYKQFKVLSKPGRKAIVSVRQKKHPESDPPHAILIILPASKVLLTDKLSSLIRGMTTKAIDVRKIEGKYNIIALPFLRGPFKDLPFEKHMFTARDLIDLMASLLKQIRVIYKANRFFPETDIDGTIFFEYENQLESAGKPINPGNAANSPSTEVETPTISSPQDENKKVFVLLNVLAATSLDSSFGKPFLLVFHNRIQQLVKSSNFDQDDKDNIQLQRALTEFSIQIFDELNSISIKFLTNMICIFDPRECPTESFYSSIWNYANSAKTYLMKSAINHLVANESNKICNKDPLGMECVQLKNLNCLSYVPADEPIYRSSTEIAVYKGGIHESLGYAPPYALIIFMLNNKGTYFKHIVNILNEMNTYTNKPALVDISKSNALDGGKYEAVLLTYMKGPLSKHIPDLADPQMIAQKIVELIQQMKTLHKYFLFETITLEHIWYGTNLDFQKKFVFLNPLAATIIFNESLSLNTKINVIDIVDAIINGIINIHKVEWDNAPNEHTQKLEAAVVAYGTTFKHNNGIPNMLKSDDYEAVKSIFSNL